MDVLSLAVDLIGQREVEMETFHPFSVEHSHLGLVLLVLHVFDHIREPNSQTMVTDSHRDMQNIFSLDFSSVSGTNVTFKMCFLPEGQTEPDNNQEETLQSELWS